MRTTLALAAALLISTPSFSLGLDDLSNRDAVTGLKQALTQGASVAVNQLGTENGFLGNAKVQIPLPDALKRAEGALKLMGMQRQADELVTSMNRAAEAAVPLAKPLLLGAIKNMSVQDAKGILSGGDTAATEYFRKATGEQLAQKFLPIVTQATNKVGLANQYNRLAGKGAQMGLVDAKQAKIENYVTEKTLDGLFLVIAEQEKAIRQDPVGTATGVARKVFGLIGK